MKTFNDLEFKKHPVPLRFDRIAQLSFENGYGVSVIRANRAYAKPDEYKVAILKDEKLCYDTHLTNDVIGYCDEQKVTEIMIEVQKL